MLLYERINKLIDIYENGNKTAFARRVGIKQVTFLGYLSEKGQKKLRVTHLNDILEQYPEVDRQWLFFGEEAEKSNAKALSAGNKLVGDYLFDIIAGVFKTSLEEFAEESGISLARLTSYVNSTQCPNWEDLKRLCAMGINPSFLLMDSKPYLTLLTPLDRMMYATGLDEVGLAILFDTELASIKQHAQQPPLEWVRKAMLHYSVSPRWITQGESPTHLSVDMVLAQRNKEAHKEEANKAEMQKMEDSSYQTVAG